MTARTSIHPRNVVRAGPLALVGIGAFVVTALLAVALLFNPSAPRTSVEPIVPTDNLAGMGGLPNPAARPDLAVLRIPLANLAGLGGLPNPAGHGARTAD